MWYCAVIILKSSIETDVNYLPLYEKSMILIKADNYDLTHKKAIYLAKEKEIEYLNGDNEQVVWKFLKIIEIRELHIDDIVDGVEVYSSFYEDAECTVLGGTSDE